MVAYVSDDKLYTPVVCNTMVSHTFLVSTKFLFVWPNREYPTGVVSKSATPKNVTEFREPVVTEACCQRPVSFVE